MAAGLTSAIGAQSAFAQEARAPEPAGLAPAPPLDWPRRGASFGISGGLGPTFTLSHGGLAKNIAGRAVAGPLLNFGVKPELDLRLDAHVGGLVGRISGDVNKWIFGGVSLAFRFNIGSIYTAGMGFSFDMGASRDNDSSKWLFSLSPAITWTPATLRFGSRGQFEIGLNQSFGFITFSITNEVTFTYLFERRPPRRPAP